MSIIQKYIFIDTCIFTLDAIIHIPCHTASLYLLYLNQIAPELPFHLLEFSMQQ